MARPLSLLRPTPARGQHGQPAPNAASPRSAESAREAAEGAVSAVRRRDAPQSIENLGEAAAVCAARRGRLAPAGGGTCPSAGPRVACPPGVPSAPRDSGGTTGAAARGRSTACRIGSTPGSPDQPNGWRDDAGSPATYGYPQFPQVYPQRTRRRPTHRHSLYRRAGSRLWITPRTRRTSSTAARALERMPCPSDYRPLRPANRRRARYPAHRRCRRPRLGECAAQRPVRPPIVEVVHQRLLSRSRRSCDSPHCGEVTVLVKGGR